MKVVTIVGARPNFIKMAPVSKAFYKYCDEVIVHTGQHYDYEMDRIFFEELSIPEPDYHLGVGSGTHGSQTGEMLRRIEEVLIKEGPDVALVIGDTNTTLAGALAAAKIHMPIAHLEAGLRSYDKSMPEEINRVLTDHCSDILFCPTRSSMENLGREGISRDVYMTGDVMVDAMVAHYDIAVKKSRVITDLGIRRGDYYLATVHRAENTDSQSNLKNIVDALCELDNVILPCHPRTEKRLKDFGLWGRLSERVKVIRPVGYYDILVLEKNAKKILTDSGGVQKEAYILKVPCVTMRKNTEWTETVEDGWNVLVGNDKDKIIRAAREPWPTGVQGDVFGDGRASERVREILVSWLSRN